MRSTRRLVVCVPFFGFLLAGCGSSNSSGSSQSAPKPPVANGGGPYTGTVGTAVSFSGSGSTDPQGQALTYAWNFGDSSTGTGVSPTHTYATLGTFTVSLAVTNTSGLTGMSTGQATIAAALSNVPLTGVVNGGQQSIVGAHVYLLAANTTGYGQASVSLLSAALTGSSDSIGAYVTTGSNGGFSLTGEYNCAGGQQLYLYALGGNSGSGANAASGLMAAIGACPSSSAPAIFATVNEVTTIAAAYAMAGFATDATHVSSSGTALAQVGVANAFANAGNLATLATGGALATTPAGNGTVPQAEIDTLANILAACVNSTGAVTGPTNPTACYTLFNNAQTGGNSGTTPSDTATAAINIAHNPGAGIAGLYGLSTANPPFVPGLTSAPNDFTLALSFTGGGLASTSSIAIDGYGNAWVPNQLTTQSVNFGLGSLSELSSSGAPLSSTGFTGGGLEEPDTVALDSAGNVWVGNIASGLSEFASTGTALSPAAGLGGGYNGGGLDLVGGVAIDGYGEVWATDYVAYNNVSEFSKNGSAISPSAGYALATGSTYGGDETDQIAIDNSGHVWVTSSYFDTVTELSQSGTVLQSFGAGVILYPGSIAIDGTGDLWITSSANPAYSTVTKLSLTGTAVSASNVFTSSGRMQTCGNIALDGGGNAWIIFQGRLESGILELTNTGVLLSPSVGYANISAGLHGIAVDGSGDVWAPTSLGSVIEIVGAATPVVTPLSAGVKNNALGARP
jgi:PKD repeat protein